MRVGNSAFALAVALSSSACGFDAAPGEPACVQGAQQLCSCGGSVRGVRTCEASSAFGACACSPGTGASAGSGGENMEPTATAGTGAGTPGAAGTAVVDMDGAAGDGAAGTGAGGSDQGTAGSAGAAAGASGAAAGGGAGEGGGGQEGGGEGGGGGSDTPPQPGDPYTHCDDTADCNDGLFCVTAMRSGETTGYCSTFCGLAVGDCPQPRSGTVGASCLPLAGVCLLDGCQNAECPDGMECVDVSSSGSGGPFGGVDGVGCEYPIDERGNSG